jgi:hypothetical protein
MLYVVQVKHSFDLPARRCQCIVSCDLHGALVFRIQQLWVANRHGSLPIAFEAIVEHKLFKKNLFSNSLSGILFYSLMVTYQFISTKIW